ncbi:hypothetical protein [Nannocystis pusilla]|uniref:hypothetical protein n=1 Tax=Nannocystis pusilla TaxID=889268 RepID=UPI003B781792
MEFKYPLDSNPVILTDGTIIFFPLANDCIFMISAEDLHDGYERGLARGDFTHGATSVAGQSPFDHGTGVVGFAVMLSHDDGHPRSLLVQELGQLVGDADEATRTARDALNAWTEWAEDAFRYLEDGADVDDAFRLAGSGLRLGEQMAAAGE